MFSIDRWQEIWGTIRRNKLRTFLTALSVAWGIFMLVLLLGAGRGLQNSVAWNFRDDAVNSIWMSGGETSKAHRGLQPGRRVVFDNADYEQIRAEVAGIEYITGRYHMWGQYQISYGGESSSFNVRSTHPDHKFLEKTEIVAGRFLNDLDQRESRKVTVIGEPVAEALFGAADPLGEWISINRIMFKVVGVFTDVGGEGELNRLYIPISTGQQAYGGGTKRMHRIMFTVGGASVDESKLIFDRVKGILAENHRFALDDERALRARNNLESFQEIAQVFTYINIFVWIVGAGTIVAGIVGVSNIMLISVKERTKEIGVRKALGATPGSVIGLILQESLLITGVSGYCGLVAGVGLLELVNRYVPDNDYLRNPTVDLRIALSATVLLVVAGLLAGFFPARRAARINPVEALRDE
jgi:putative ABC transport system permease protein